MKNYLITDGKGLITSTIRGSYNEALQTCHFLGLGYDMVETEVEATPSLHYVVDGVVVDRPRMSLVVVGNKVGGIPPGSTITCRGISYPDQSGEVELDFDIEGIHRVFISCGVYVDETVEVTWQA